MTEPTNLTPKWEYMSESPVSMERMNELGAEGWELVWYNAYFDQKEYAMKSIAIFKRTRYEQTEGAKTKPNGDAEAEFIAKYGDNRLGFFSDFTNRLTYALADVGICTLNDLLRFSRKTLKRPKGMGPKSLRTIDEFYEACGLRYGEEELLPDPDRKTGGGFMAYKMPPKK